jgi:hypothetical protein
VGWYFPFYALLYWLFYDETATMGVYDITLQYYIYYILWAIILIIFNIIIDIIFFNIMEQFNKVNFLEALQIMEKNFKDRFFI